MRIFRNAWFDEFARKEQVRDAMLVDAIRRAELALVDADVGAGLIKQRMARPSRGNSAGYRTRVFFRSGKRAVFVFGFAKNDRENVSAEEEAALRRAAKPVLGLPDHAMNREAQSARMKEVTSSEQVL